MKRKLLFRSIIIALFLILAQPFAGAETINLPPVGEYAKIDVKLAEQSIKDLTQGSPAEKEKRIAAIKSTPEKYVPAVFYVLSNQLFSQGQKEEGAFWFYAGQLRARYDANRCADISARSGVAVLNQEYGPMINKYMFQHIDKLEALIPKVIDWDRTTPHDYDQRWLNLHGMGAIETSLGDTQKQSLSLPEAQWEEIAEKTRKDYMEGFREAMIEAKKRAQH